MRASKKSEVEHENNMSLPALFQPFRLIKSHRSLICVVFSTPSHIYTIPYEYQRPKSMFRCISCHVTSYLFLEQWSGIIVNIQNNMIYLQRING